MDDRIYKVLEEMVEIFDNSTIDGDNVWCFEFIKKIVDGEILKEDIDENIKLLARKQFEKEEEWFRLCFGIEMPYNEELKVFLM